MELTRKEIEALWIRWNSAWDSHDLEGVMAFFHEDIYFSNWTGGRAKGKDKLRQAWKGWFADHGNFAFVQEDVFIDVAAQKLLYQWELTWPSFEAGFQGKEEKRKGVDIIHFKDGKIIRKLTYSKTFLDIDGERIRLAPQAGATPDELQDDVTEGSS